MNPWLEVATFLWLVIYKRFLTGENLRRQGVVGLSQCTLYSVRRNIWSTFWIHAPWFQIFGIGGEIFSKYPIIS